MNEYSLAWRCRFSAWPGRNCIDAYRQFYRSWAGDELDADASVMVAERFGDGSREPSDSFDIGVADGYGFLVEVRDGQVHLHPTIYDGSSGPCPSLDLQAHCSAMDEKMQAFARQFMR